MNSADCVQITSYYAVSEEVIGYTTSLVDVTALGPLQKQSCPISDEHPGLNGVVVVFYRVVERLMNNFPFYKLCI